MRILVDIGHPAHVHLFKNLIWSLGRKGHEVKITTRDKDIALHLLNAYGLKYENQGKHYRGLLNKMYGVLKFDYRLYKVAKKFKPDILTSMGSPYATHVAKLIGKPSITFDDTEHSRIEHILYSPFTDAICTPSCFKKDLGPKQVRFNGYHELAYLHPNYFKPDPSVLDELNLTKNDKFFILRFVSWSASHDIGQKGFIDKTGLIKNLGEHGTVLITSEGPLTKEIEKFKITISPEKIHDLLYYATMYIGEGATMATEAGILGTPSIYLSSLVGTMGNFDELEKEYGLVYSFTDSQKARRMINELLNENNLKIKWQKKREKLLKEKIDVTAWMIDFIERYPESFYEYKN